MMSDPVGAVPPGYVVHRVADAWLVLDRVRADALVALRLGDPAARRALFARAPRRGRGVAPSVPLAGGGSAVLRRYRHGGALARLTGALFLGPRRALSELHTTARAEAAGAPVPHALCLVAWPVLGPLWSALIGTSEESGAVSLLESLDRAHSQRDRAERAREVGAALRRLHDAGVEHRDLQLGNVLWRDADVARRVVVVDLDGARFHGRPLDARRRAGNLGRFVRSGVKARARGAALGRRELAALVGGYCAGDRGLRAALRARAPLERVKLALHRASYPLRGAAPQTARSGSFT